MFRYSLIRDLHISWLFFILSWTLSGCGAQDPAFGTKDGGELSEDIATNPDNLSDVTDSLSPEELAAKQEQLCLESEVPMQECFANFKLMSLEKTQGVAGALDILWIIDNSGSMSEEQTYLKTNFNNFITQLAAKDIDFQLAVTSTDACQDTIPADLTQVRCPVNAGGNGNHHQGSFRGNPGAQVLNDNNPNLVTLFNDYAWVGTTGSGFEHGLTAAQLAIEKVVSGQNDPLVRNSAYLAVIVVSDEEDDGIGLSMTDAYSGQNYWNLNQTRYRYTEDNLINYLMGQKGEGKFSISTITSTLNPSGSICSAPHSQPQEVGSQYIAAATKTGGIVQSICSTSWDDTMTELGKDLGSQMTQIYLETEPVISTIRVYIDDQASYDWSYVEVGRLVKFSSDHIPAAGATIRIEYLTQAN